MTTTATRSDRQPLAGGYTTLGLRFTLHCSDDALAGRLEELYRGCRDDARGAADLDLEIERDPTTGYYELRELDRLLCRSTDPEDVLAWCAWRVNQAGVGRARTPLVLHAAAVARDGLAVLLIGPSGVGKSTLATALTLSGFSYMGDDGVAIEDGAPVVRSNPKPIRLDGASRAAVLRLDPANTELQADRQLFAPGKIGSVHAVHRPVPIAAVILPRFQSTAPNSMTPLPPPDIAEVLADESFNFATDGAASLHTVAAVARAARGFLLGFDDVAPAVAMIDEKLG